MRRRRRWRGETPGCSRGRTRRDCGACAPRAGAGRAEDEYRLGVTATSREEAARLLRGNEHPRKIAGRAGTAAESGVAFLFTGQGSQYPLMGLALYESEPFFREIFDRCAQVL